MFLFIHSLGVRFLGIAITIASLFNQKAREWKEGRRNYWNKLPAIATQKGVVWFHCASLGEFDQGIPVMQELKKRNPSIFILVTFFSPSGMKFYHKRNHPADWVGYLPLPTKKNARRFVKHFHPQEVFFVKYEFWAYFLKETKRINSKNYCISANFRENQLFFGNFGRLFNPVLFLFDKIFVQNENSLQLLHKIGYQNAYLTGDTRIDKVFENKEKITKDNVVENFLSEQKAIILGSSWPVGENLWKSFIDSHPNLKFIIAPHDISEKHLVEIEKLFPTIARYSKIEKGEKLLISNILLIDCIGKLSNLYQYAQIAYVGGGFTGNLHNILEPGIFGIPILIGPKHEKFPEAQLLIEKGIAFEIRNSDEIDPIFQKLSEKRDKIREKSLIFFENNKNVSSRIVNIIEKGKE